MEKKKHAYTNKLKTKIQHINQTHCQHITTAGQNVDSHQTNQTGNEQKCLMNMTFLPKFYSLLKDK